MAVLFRNSKGGQILHGGETIAKKGCWSLLKGGIVSNFTGYAEVLFEVNNFCLYQLRFDVPLNSFSTLQHSSKFFSFLF